MNIDQDRTWHDVIGETSDAVEAVQMVCDLKPDVILMDIEMPQMGGLEAIQKIKSRYIAERYP